MCLSVVHGVHREVVITRHRGSCFSFTHYWRRNVARRQTPRSLASVRNSVAWRSLSVHRNGDCSGMRCDGVPSFSLVKRWLACLDETVAIIIIRGGEGHVVIGTPSPLCGIDGRRRASG